MKRPPHFFMIAVIAMAIVSCSQKKLYENSTTFTAEHFKRTQQLKGSTITFDSLIMKPTNIKVVDSILILVEPSLDRLIHLFNLKTKQWVNGCIRKGQGPKDMIYPVLLTHKNGILKIMDLATSTLYEYGVADLLSEVSPTPVRRTRLAMPIFGDVALLEENIVGTIDDNKYQLCIFDAEGNDVKKIASFPTIPLSASDIEMKEMFFMNITSNEKDKIVLCYRTTDLIEIYDSQGDLQKRLHGPQQFISLTKQMQDGKITGAMYDRAAKDAYYTPQNAGEQFFVRFNGKEMNKADFSSASNQLYSFSWEGVPQTMYLLDEPIHSFTVDSHNKKIFAISNIPEYHIIEYSYE